MSKEKECCGICMETYTKILRKKCICKYCNAPTCSKCIERYLLDRHEDAHCLHCRVNYNDAMLKDICTKTYLQHTYFKHRQEVLINRERANLPGLQDIAITEMKQRADEANIVAIKAEIAPIEKQRDIIMIEYSKIYKDENLDGKRDELLAKMEEYRIEIDKKREEIQEIRYNIYHKEEKEEKEEKRKFIRRCTRDNCQGFLSTAWKCGICEYYSCSKCFKPKTKKQDDPHECVKDDLDTAELIKKDCKPCPNCGEFIMKSSGCFAKNTPIPTWTSYKMSQDIVVGDELIGDDCLKRTVVEVCSGVDRLYEVTQSHGVTYTVNSKHTLVLKYKKHIPYWKDGYWYIEWFDQKELVPKIHRILGPSIVTHEIMDEIETVMKTIPIDIEIIVEDYMKLDDSIKKKLYGFKFQDSYLCSITAMDILTLRSTIDVRDVGLGEYYGWKLDSNHRFILSDDTVLHNCDQMWCLSCKTPWSWNTGKVVVSGPIHNPHYYEWMRRNGSAPRNPADVPCGGYPGIWELRKMPKYVKNSHLYFEFHRLCLELQEMSERNYRSHIDDTTNGINIKFLLGDYDEKHWGQQLGKNERKRKRDAEVQEIFAAFRMVAVELINRIHNHDKRYAAIPVPELEAFIDSLHVEIKALVTMINEALRNVSISYSYSVPYLVIDAKYYTIITKNFKDKKHSTNSISSNVEPSDVEPSNVELSNVELSDESIQLQRAIEASLAS